MALQEEFEQQGNKLFKYRGSIPLAFLVTGILVFIYSKMHLIGIEKYISFYTYELICLGISFLGLAIRIYTVGYSPRNTSGRNTGSQIADEVNTTGIYSLVRHPLYVGNFFMWLGIAMLVQNFWYVIIFVLTYWVYYERIMFAEEQFLRKKFAKAYLDWAEHTPAFIPSFKNYSPPKISFSWKKVIKKEKNGFVAIFMVFFLLRVIGDYIETESLVLDSWLFFITVATSILYFILKYIKKYTTVFDEAGR